ncbi:endonuclease domain-containing protein [Sphingomonas sp.]|uniref:endonuclease domain-containing protein n=1 Tax=Sphingomonas sp. TaxID=28214 RepID=UPI0025FCAAE7|nr:DUF559 domain-containing protein [Sphingomonas sp.]
MANSRYTVGDGTIARACKLRRDATPAEQKLWNIPRVSQLGGAKFRRQQRVGPYYADFVSQSARVVIEIDGDTHATNSGYDTTRTAYLVQEGYRVPRFTNIDVMANGDGVAAVLLAALAPSSSHSATPSGPLPLSRGERE